MPHSETPQRTSLRSVLTSDALLAATVGMIAFSVYLRTLLPDVGGPEDSPKFQYLGAVLGTAHPPGYPLHTMLSHAFSYVPVGSIAYRANLLSAVLGAVAVSLAALLARATGSSRPSAAMGALALAFGAAFWNYAVLAEVYTLGAALLLGIVYWLVRWRQTRRDAHLFAAAFCFALALGNHLSIAAAAPAIAVFLLVTDARRAIRLRTLLPAAAIVASGFLQYIYILSRTRHGSPYREASAATLSELVEVVRARDYQDYVFAFSWHDLLSARLPEFGRLVRSELGVIGIGLAVLGLFVLLRRDWRVATLLSLAFGGVCTLLINLFGDLRGFLVVPLALAPPMVAAGGDALRSVFTLLPGRVWPALSAIVVLIYPASLARANFSANDWHRRTGEASFFRALFERLPSRVALVTEDYVADSVVTYLQAAEGGDQARTLLQPRPDPATVREMFASGTPVFVLDIRRADLAPRGFHFEPVDLSSALDRHAASGAVGTTRHAYRLAGRLPTVEFGDAQWHDITAALEGDSVSLLVDNYREFDARVILYAAGAAPFRPMVHTQHRYGRGRPSVHVRQFDLDVALERHALRSALAADAVTDEPFIAADRHITRIEHRVNDDGQYAAWAVALRGVPRLVIGFAQPDRPHVSRAVASALPPDRFLVRQPSDDVPLGSAGERWLGPGWHGVERDAEGEFRWTAARDAWLMLPLLPPGAAGPVTLSLDVIGRAGTSVQLIVNGRELGPCWLTGGWRPCTWSLAPDVVRAGANGIAVRASKIARPSDEGPSKDTRLLGVAVRRIRLAR